MCAIAGLLMLYAFTLRPALDAILGFEFPLRLAIVVALIGPLGFLMGMPFPWAIAQLSRADQRLVPFAWVINGAASVIGGSITVMVAMTFGFTAVFGMAAGLYLTAAFTARRVVNAAPAQQSTLPVAA